MGPSFPAVLLGAWLVGDASWSRRLDLSFSVSSASLLPCPVLSRAGEPGLRPPRRLSQGSWTVSRCAGEHKCLRKRVFRTAQRFLSAGASHPSVTCRCDRVEVHPLGLHQAGAAAVPWGGGPEPLPRWLWHTLGSHDGLRHVTPEQPRQLIGGDAGDSEFREERKILGKSDAESCTF